MKRTVFFIYDMDENCNLVLVAARKTRAAAMKYREESGRQEIICKTEVDMCHQSIDIMELLYGGGFRFNIENGKVRV